jgi:protocatechuate 3,4-dioxygenase beta subunit
MKRTVLIIAAIALAACTKSEAEQKAAKHEPMLGDCDESCEWVFVGLSRDSLSWSTRIAPTNEPGEPMRLEGVVRDAVGHAAPGIIVYAYHTNVQGIYPRSTEYPNVRHGRLRAWTKTNAEGRYRFDTIRPAGYPKTDIPQHVHMQVIEPGRCEYTIDEILFDDDPRLTKEERSKLSERGGPGVVHPSRDANGVWLVTRDIVLGANVPGYPAKH